MTHDQLVIAQTIIFHGQDPLYTEQLKGLHTLRTNSRTLRTLIEAWYGLIIENRKGDIRAEYLKRGGTKAEWGEFFDDIDDMLLASTIDAAITAETNASRVDELRSLLPDVELGRMSWEDLRAAFFEMEEDDRRSMSLEEIADAYKNREKDIYHPFGFHHLDLAVRGMCRRRVSILAARPSVGKTSLSLAVSTNALWHGSRVFWASLEMDEFELYERLQAQTQGKTNWPGHLDVDPRPDLTVPQIAASVNGSKYDLVIIDHLGKVKYTGRYHGIYEKTTAVMEQLRVAAKYSEAAWLVPCQLNREVPDEHTRPRLTNLRDTGTIEEDAHAVYFLHEPDRREDLTAPSRVVELTVAKNRGGPLTRQMFRFHMAASSWEEE